MLFYINRMMEIVLLPPGCILLMSLIGLGLWQFHPQIGKFLIIFSIVLLWILSTPAIAQILIDKLQYHYPILTLNEIKDNKTHTAIVVLEAGLNLLTPEYDNKPIVSTTTLSRLRYAALLYNKIKSPILVSGNDPNHSKINQADYMADILKFYFNIPTQWKESKGFNTAEEGKFSKEILQKSGINKIYLVTSAYHMPRSVISFKANGFEVIPAPTEFKSFDHELGKLAQFLPQLSALEISTTALREYIGICWYHIYYRY